MNVWWENFLNIDPKKATTENSISSKTLKLSNDISADVLQNRWSIYPKHLTRLITTFWLQSFAHYGFSNDSLKLLRSHRTKINQKFSSWKQLSQGVPQGSVLGPYLNDLFFLSEFTDLCNFADDTIFYTCDMGLRSLIKRLEHDSFLAVEWFENNNMKFNHDKVPLARFWI